MNENLTKKPVAGLSPVEMALEGSGTATEKLLTAYPKLGQRPPSGLSVLEMAQLGSESARKRILEAVNEQSSNL